MHAKIPDRIYVSLKPSTMKSIFRLSAAMGKPRATVVTDMIEENADVIAQLADALIAAKEAEQQAKTLWRSDLQKASSEAERLAHEAQDIVANLFDKATDGRAARPRAAGAGASVGGRP